MITVVSVLAVLFIILLIKGLKIVQEYERGVLFFLGKARTSAPLKPGLHFIIPFLHRLQRIDMRVQTLIIPPQEIMTKDNVSARINAVVMFEVSDPIRAILQVESYARAASEIAQTTLRSVVGRQELDKVLAHRDDINQEVQSMVSAQTQLWGVSITVVQIKDVEIPQTMQRALAKEAEAERERRAKIISAKGELQSADELAQASEKLNSSPAALQLRYLQTLLELGADQNSTIVFPLPLDIVKPFLQSSTPPAP